MSVLPRMARLPIHRQHKSSCQRVMPLYETHLFAKEAACRLNGVAIDSPRLSIDPADNSYRKTPQFAPANVSSAVFSSMTMPSTPLDAMPLGSQPFATVLRRKITFRVPLEHGSP